MSDFSSPPPPPPPTPSSPAAPPPPPPSLTPPPGWFVIYSLVPVAILISQASSTLSGLGNRERATAETIIYDGTVTLISALVSIAGAIAFGIMARGLTSRHQQLTGELTR